MISVRESARFITSNPEFVSIDKASVSVVAQKIFGHKFREPLLEHDQQLAQSAKEETAMACFLLDSLNFGIPYWSLVSVLKQAISESKKWLSPQFLSQLTRAEVLNLFLRGGTVSLLNERHTAIQEIGEGFKAGGEDGAWQMIPDSFACVETFLDTVVSRFPSFCDEAIYRGEKVGFYKRAQLLAMDLNLMVAVHGIVPFQDLEKLTAFADNALPRLLRDEGILIYSRNLAQRVDQGIALPAGSAEEVEIRGSTVQAVELLRIRLEAIGRQMTSSQLDTILWTEADQRKHMMKPSHRTVSIFY